MPRAATTSDIFNAVAEARRRDILAFLAADERPVGDIVSTLNLAQPSVSKHLKVLRDVGLVYVKKAGKQRLYGLDAQGLEPIHRWTGGFEEFWRGSFERLNRYVEDLQRKETPHDRIDTR